MLKIIIWTFTLLLLPTTVLADDFGQKLSVAAIERTKQDVRYDGRYISIAYPGGDVPANIGVCTDVVIRSYRAVGYDLQKLVHEDMKANFQAYPDIWGLTRTDRNIDHRRVPNLRTFFTRNGQSLTTGENASDAYLPGDLVSWKIGGRLAHIAVVTNKLASDGKTLLVSHNMGSGPRLENVLFAWPMTGHYRFNPTASSATTNATGQN
ncbi:MAG: DUF1287 domain-containing protein [Robiginitomaculum sp.]|nr:DUF1287 domain-containing protein [Robiginitomaculum sp.]